MVCRWCGESSHPSSDCMYRGRGAPAPAAAAAADPKVVTKDYYDLMVSLGEDVSGMVVQGGNQEEGFNQFLASVGVDPRAQSAAQSGYGNGPQSGRYGGGAGPYGSGQYGGGYNRGGPQQGAYNDRGYTAPQGSVDDIPPWELMDQGGQQPRPSADAPLPWEQ